MQRVINHLVQLQELTLIRDEQKVAAAGDRLEELDTAIKTLTEQLPTDVRPLFDRLHKRNRLAIVPIGVRTCCTKRGPCRSARGAPRAAASRARSASRAFPRTG